MQWSSVTQFIRMLPCADDIFRARAMLLSDKKTYVLTGTKKQHLNIVRHLDGRIPFIGFKKITTVCSGCGALSNVGAALYGKRCHCGEAWGDPPEAVAAMRTLIRMGIEDPEVLAEAYVLYPRDKK